MAKKRLGPEQVVTKLRQIEVLMGEGLGLQKAPQDWLATAGARNPYIERGSPWENGYNERLTASYAMSA